MSTVPDLEWEPPYCPICEDEQVEFDGDSWTCPSCERVWSADGTGGQLPDPS